MARTVIDVIKDQHRQVDSLLEQAAQEGADTAALIRQVADMLLAHSQAEESFVYPTIAQRAKDEGEEVADGTAEHHHIEAMLEDLLTTEPGSPGYDGILAAMTAELRHHVEEEETDLLPALEKAVSTEELVELGRRFAEATGEAAAAAGPGSSDLVDLTKDELYQRAQEQDVPGRSSMTKEELARAVE